MEKEHHTKVVIARESGESRAWEKKVCQAT
jgi:hypothetical protein